MLGRFLPVENRFFDLFDTHAQHIVLAACEVQMLLDNLDDAELAMANVQTTERTGDKLAHDAIDLLHKTFITPLDRDEIHKLVTTMDDILDLMEDVSLTISLYDVTNVTDEARQLATICVACCEEVRKAVALLSDMNNGRQILTIAHEIDRLESDADRVMRAAMAKLFRTENDIKLLIKLKAIYEQLESITDRCEDVANIIEGIVLENA